MSEDSEIEQEVSSFLDGQGPGNDTEELDGGVDAAERAREAEEEGERYDEMQSASPADDVEVEENPSAESTEQSSKQSEDTQQDARGERQDQSEKDGREERDEDEVQSESEMDDEESLDVELDDDLEDILGEGTSEEQAQQEQDTEQDDRSEYVQKLEQRIEQLEEQLPSEESETQQVNTVDEPSQQEKLEFVSNEEELQEVVDDVDNFNELMSRMFHTMREEVTRVVPQIAQQTFKQRQRIQKSVDKFWENNPDLKDWNKQVQAVAQEVQAQNPDAEPIEVLRTAGKEVRDRLDLHKQAKETEEKSSSQDSGINQPPTPGGSSSGPPSGQDATEKEQEVQEMLDATT